MYSCRDCNFNTKRKSDWKRHINTKKHKLNTNEHNLNTNEQKSTTCKECGKILSCKSSLKRHFNKYCKKTISKKQKKLIEENNMKELLRQKEQELLEKEKEITNIIENKEKQLEEKEKEMNRIIQKKDKYKKEINNLKQLVYENQREFIDYAKTQNKSKNVSNVFYIQNHYKNASTMDQILDEWDISYPEWVRATIKGYVAGCTELIENQFIKKRSLPDRPLHCLDPSRGILMYNDGELGWMKNAPVDINTVIDNVDDKFNKFNRDYQSKVPENEELRIIKEDIQVTNPTIYYATLEQFNSFIPPKITDEEGKDSEYEKSKKRIIKNISLKCAFNKPKLKNEILNKVSNTDDDI